MWLEYAHGVFLIRLFLSTLTLIVRVRKIKKKKKVCLFFESESEYGWTGKEREAHKTKQIN